MSAIRIVVEVCVPELVLKDQKKPVPNAGTESGPGRMFPNALDKKFPKFFWEKYNYREIAFGNADL